MKASDSKEYQEHEVFKQLDVISDFYNGLSWSTMMWSTMGTRAIINLDTYVYSSIEGTIESITEILKNGRINDAYALLRKYYDSTIINIYTNLYLADNFSIENFLVKQIDGWLQGKEKMPEYRVMSQYIRNSDKLKPISDLILQDNRYKVIRDRCNDHTHYNFYQHLHVNDNQVSLNRIALLNTFQRDIETLFIQHFAYIFYLNDHYFMSSDHMDYLEMGDVPPEDSQHWVANFIQNIFTVLITVRRPDIAAVIKKNTSMQLD